MATFPSLFARTRSKLTLASFCAESVASSLIAQLSARQNDKSLFLSSVFVLKLLVRSEINTGSCCVGSAARASFCAESVASLLAAPLSARQNDKSLFLSSAFVQKLLVRSETYTLEVVV
jgi:hypothetical protein